MFYSQNQLIPMTRRYPNLRDKVLKRDSKIAHKLIQLWDELKDGEAVLEYFIKECKNLSDQRYWELLKNVWIVCGGLDNVDVFKKLMSSNRKHKYCFMSPEESQELYTKDACFDVYRACNEENDNGISWTTNWLYALDYKDKYQKKIVQTKTVFRSEVFAYINRANEYEIILL